MRFFRLRSALLVASVCATVSFAGATSAFASGSSCTYGASNGNTRTCMSVNGSGLHINSATASAHVVNVGRTLEVCMTGPAVGSCSGFVFVSPGQTLSGSWSPNANEPTGDYCAVTYRQNANGSQTQIGRACVNVHS